MTNLIMPTNNLYGVLFILRSILFIYFNTDGDLLFVGLPILKLELFSAELNLSEECLCLVLNLGLLEYFGKLKNETQRSADFQFLD
jgi:hypothetical protein